MDSRVIEVIYFMHITRLLHIKKNIYIFSLYIGDEMMFSQNYFNFGKKFHIFFFYQTIVLFTFDSKIYFELLFNLAYITTHFYV